MNISGNIKEDEQEVFNIVCERTGVEPSEAKGVGFFNRLIKLCSVAKLSVTFDYEDQSGNGKFTVSNVPGSGAIPSVPNQGLEDVVEEEPAKEEYVAPAELNQSDADEDDDPFATD